MRIAIIGANGQLGTDLCRELDGDEVTRFVRADFDVRDHVAAAAALDAVRPEVVINTTAFHRVDDCETEVEPAFAVNALAVHALARWCADHQATLAHFSSDYVFAGTVPQPRTESDSAEPASVYGTSKLAGELLVRATCPRHYVIRTSGLYGAGGSRGKGGANFVGLMLRLAREGRSIRVVADQVLTPTYTVDLAQAVGRLIRTGRFGLYHVTNAGACSWYEFALEVFALAGVRADISPTTTAEYGARAQRPAYSVLAHRNLLAAGLPELPEWKDALGRYVGSSSQSG